MANTLLGLLAAALLAGCAAHPSTPPPTAAVTAPAPAPVGVAVLPASNHVSGRYPTSCRAVVLASGAVLPDRTCTPGAASAAVTQTNLSTTICRSGYAGSVRAPRGETSTVKRAAIRAYQVPATTPTARIELDHTVPLELGGSNDTSNLWPQPSDLPGTTYRNRKDTVEGHLHTAVCTGRVPLAKAQNAIALDWTTAEHAVGLQ